MSSSKDNAIWTGNRRETPRHVAIIMDGNGRWATERGVPRFQGHRRGVESVRNIVRVASDLGIEYLTLFSFSSENWSRPAQEILDLMGLLKRFIRRDLAELHKNGVKIKVIGTRDGIESEIVKLLDEAEKLTADNERLNLIVAFNYGGRDEIARAARSLAQKAQDGSLSPDKIDKEMFARHLDTAGIPDPDLLIRTSGEFRLSNFLLWQCAYSELVFMDVYWPEFTVEHLHEAIDEYCCRERRFGGRPAKTLA